MNMEYGNKLFDFVMTEALKEYMNMELKEVDKLVAKEPPHEFSQEFERKMKKVINSIGRKDRIKKFKRVAIKTALSAAVVVSFVFGGLLTQPEVLAAVQNVFKSVFDKYDKYEYVGEELTIEDFDNSFRLGYVPDGYYLSEGNYSPVRVTLIYTDQTNEIIFEYGISNFTTTSYDNEHNSYETFDLNGVEYHYYKSNDADFDDRFIWYKNGYAFGIYAHLSKDELVKIAENIEN